MAVTDLRAAVLCGRVGQREHAWGDELNVSLGHLVRSGRIVMVSGCRLVVVLDRRENAPVAVADAARGRGEGQRADEGLAFRRRGYAGRASVAPDTLKLSLGTWHGEGDGRHDPGFFGSHRPHQCRAGASGRCPGLNALRSGLTAIGVINGVAGIIVLGAADGGANKKLEE
ncbi:MAG: hypothetical protein WCC90_16735 [Methylocella sp.]